jgi:hypothetical protein
MHADASYRYCCICMADVLYLLRALRTCRRANTSTKMPFRGASGDMQILLCTLRRGSHSLGISLCTWKSHGIPCNGKSVWFATLLPSNAYDISSHCWKRGSPTTGTIAQAGELDPSLQTKSTYPCRLNSCTTCYTDSQLAQQVPKGGSPCISTAGEHLIKRCHMHALCG